MNADTFCENFATFAEAPYGVNKLRELVLQLAIQGRLTASGIEDECVSGLRLRTQSATKQLIDDGAIRYGNEFDPIESDETSYSIPREWKWVRIGEVMQLINGKAFRPSEWCNSGLPIVRIQNLNNKDAPFNYADQKVDDKILLQTGDFLISWSGTPGTSFGAFIWDRGPAVLNQHIFKAVMYGETFVKPFLRIAINARLDEMIAQAHGGVGLQHITKGKLERLSLPLPPLAEQKRIVAKVEELLGLCDELEARQTERDERRKRLVASSLESLVACQSAVEFPKHANRVRDNFDRLFDTPTTIPQLRQTILQLAVQQTLVERDNVGKPAEEVRVGDVVSFLGGYAFKSEWFKKGEGIRLVRNQNISHGKLDWSDTEYLPKEIAIDFSKFRLQVGDLVLSLNRPFISTGLKLAWITKSDCPCLLVQRVACLRPERAHLLAEYLFLWCNAPHFYRDAHIVPSSGVPYIAMNRVEVMSMMLPPLAEQKRIVAKVGQLMQLCDQLESNLKAAEAKNSTLMSAAILRLLSKTV